MKLVKFRLMSTNPDYPPERVWGLVKEEREDGYLVEIDNDPLMPDFKYGDEILVPKEFVLDVMEEDA